MVLDHIINCEKYYNQHPRFKMGFEFLKNLTEKSFDQTRVDLDGDNCFVLLYRGDGRGSEQITLEAHRNYIDIQYVFDGSDLIGYRDLSECEKIKQAYDAEKDFIFFNDAPSCNIDVQKKYFTLFFPNDAHAPQIGTAFMLKAVVKVKI
jgi:biofilm protein TabA